MRSDCSTSFTQQEDVLSVGLVGFVGAGVVIKVQGVTVVGAAEAHLHGGLG